VTQTTNTRQLFDLGKSDSRKDRLFEYLLPAAVLTIGALLWIWGFSAAGLGQNDAGDITNLGAGILGGGLVAFAVVWTESRVSARQDKFLTTFQISMQSDLAGIDLTDADLTQAHLSGKILHHARLSGAKLDASTLIGTNLDSADLSRASLVGARLIDTTLRSAVLTATNLTSADLTDADLTGAVLVNTKFDGSIVTNAKFTNVTAIDCSFVGVAMSAEQRRDLQI
jgi:uncharacterized protein YjbI with pentapeptide repeats